MHNLRFQRDLFWEDTEENLELIKQYFNVQIIDPQNPFPEYEQGIFYLHRCSIAVAQKMNIFEKFTNALEWAGKLRKEMVDPHHVFVDMDFVNEQLKYPDWPDSNKKFIRPASGSKIFAGNVYDDVSFQKEVDFLFQRNVDPRTVMCLVSYPKQIKLEYRTIFIGGDYVSGSRYMVNGELDVDDYVPINVQVYAKNIHKMYDLPPWVVLDIADVYGGGDIEDYKVIELNQFETSSFYAADLDKIYSTWSKTLA